MKKLLILFLSLNLAFFSPFASAYFDIAKYKKNSHVAAGSRSSIGYSVVQTPGSQANLWTGLQRQAKPNTVASLFKKLGPTAAFSAAVYGILGAVDWILDPENNRIQYDVADDPDVDPDFKYEGYYRPEIVFRNEPSENAAYLNSKQAMLDRLKSNKPDCYIRSEQKTYELAKPYTFTPRTRVATHIFYLSECGVGSENINIYAERRTEPPVTDTRYLSYEDIATKVIANADAGDLVAQEDTKAANDPETWIGTSDPNGDPEPELKANEKPYPCKVRNSTDSDSCFKIGGQLDQDKNDNKPDDSSDSDSEPASKVELPAFCDWAKPACNFFVNSLTQSRAFFATANQYFETVKTYLSEEDPELTEPEEPDIQLPIELQSYEVNFSSFCPAPRTFNVNGGSSFTFDMTLTCEVLSKIRYAFIGLSSFVAFRILSGKDS